MPLGTVIAFDDHVGLGEVESADGEVYLFHCVEIADGSRTIQVGAAVEFDLMRKLGRLEAAQLRPAPAR
jgi:cold shock CspA family protein